MPVSCTFTLNNKPLSTLMCYGFGGLSAFSGYKGVENNPAKTALKEIGPLPKGKHYIVSREVGGKLGFLRDSQHTIYAGSNITKWFSLYRADNKIDDYTFIEGVKRGNFRLHPTGYGRVSDGCITIPDHAGFTRLRDFILKTPKIRILGSDMMSYGTVEVK